MVARDDIYYMPDYFNDGIVRAVNDRVYAELRDSGVRINFMVHDNLPIFKPQYFPKGTAETHERWLRSIVTSADQIICISQDVADQTARWIEDQEPALRPPPKLVVLHHGADIGAASSTNGLPEDAAVVLDELSGRPSFLMVGTIESLAKATYRRSKLSNSFGRPVLMLIS